MNSFSDNIKSVIIVILVLVLGLSGAMRLMEIQVVGGDGTNKKNSSSGSSSFVYTRSVAATRGEIMDYSGNLIVSNTACKNIVLRKALFPEDNAEGNYILLTVYNELKIRGYHVETHLPISKTTPYVFTSDDTDELKSDLSLNVYATAENCIDKLIDDYEIAETYSEEEKRIIAGLRYELMYMDFSYSNDFLLAEDVDSDTVIKMKELSNILRGVDAVDSVTRQIVRGDILPHEIGTIGPIWAEEYDELKEKGYALNDVLGKSGIEKAMETELRGQNGSEKITVNNGQITAIDLASEAKSGSTVKLTVNGTYQLELQSILDNFIANFPSINTNSKLKDVNCGAIVVLDAKTGAVRGAANAPTYNLLDYVNDYESVLNAENAPLFNRATYGLYKPGSTFKTITATAGLNEGIVNDETSFVCQRNYEYKGSPYHCTGSHGNISVTRAIQVSCNIYFYELSQRLGIDTINEYAGLYGLGQHTGIETGDAAGYLASPEEFEKRDEPWYIGYVLQAGIGNIDCGMTPLQMANVACTIANNGVRYTPYIVDSLYEYNTNNVSYKTQPKIAAEIELNYDYVYDCIEEGMIAASHNMPAKYSLSNLGFDVAIKTGTPQRGSNGEQDSFFIGYAPADDPEVAFAGVIEGGEYSKYMIRDILLAYQRCYGLNGVAPTAVLNPETQTDTGTATGTGTDTGTGTNTGSNINQTQTETVTQAQQPTDVQPQTDSPAEPQSEAHTETPSLPEQPSTLPPETQDRGAPVENNPIG